MQVQALPGASLHDGRERVEHEDRQSVCVSARVTDAFVSSGTILRVARSRMKLPVQLRRSGVEHCLRSTERYIARGFGGVWTLGECDTGTCA